MPQKRRRSAGEGTIYKNANDTWTAQIRTESGRPSFTHKSERKVRSWLTQQRRDLDTGDYIEPSGMTLGKWWDKWVATYKSKSVGPATLQSYRYSRARLPQSLLDGKLCDITPADIQGALNGLQGGRRTVEITRTALHMCFERAVQDQMIRRNPTDRATIPPDDHLHKAKALTDADDAELLKRLTAPCRTLSGRLDQRAMQTQTIRDALFFVRMTGVRRSEAVGLMWDDVTDRIHIKGTKNQYSDRIIPYPADVRAMIDRRRFTRNSDYVFATSTGKKIDGSNLLRWMATNTNCTVHDLRHTYITRAAQAGVNPKVLQTITGHARVETLLDVYTHVTDDMQDEAVAKIMASSK